LKGDLKFGFEFEGIKIEENKLPAKLKARFHEISNEVSLKLEWKSSRTN
jgi:hypothetical protein